MRSEASKTAEILVLRQVSILRRRSHALARPGRPYPAQRAGPTAPQDSSPTSTCHPRHALALTGRLGYTMVAPQEPAARPPTHVTAAAQDDSASRQREPGLGIPTHRWRTC